MSTGFSLSEGFLQSCTFKEAPTFLKENTRPGTKHWERGLENLSRIAQASRFAILTNHIMQSPNK